MKATLICLTTLLLFICNKETAKCDPYFQYDEIQHYRLDTDVYDLYGTDTSEQMNRRRTLASDDYTINTGMFTDLEKLGYSKQIMPKTKFAAIDSFLCKKIDRSMHRCEVIYRDILLFKQNKIIVGYARICFDCEVVSIVGPKKNKEGFGKESDFQVLAKLLSN